MAAREPEDFRTLYVDPGEDTGWVIGKDLKLLAGGTMRMWKFFDEVWAALGHPDDPSVSILNGGGHLREGVTAEENLGPIKRIVMEDWRLYPNKLKHLQWDQCRTARLIGGLTGIARIEDVEVVLQPAAIKDAAKAGGAEELYWRPLRENRHQNDAAQHFVFYTQTELVGLPSPIDLKSIPGATSRVSDEEEA